MIALSSLVSIYSWAPEPRHECGGPCFSSPGHDVEDVQEGAREAVDGAWRWINRTGTHLIAIRQLHDHIRDFARIAFRMPLEARSNFSTGPTETS